VKEPEHNTFFMALFTLSTLFWPLPEAIAAKAEKPGLEAEQLPIFDTHVHYKEPAWAPFPPKSIIALMQKHNVVKALVSSSPDEGTRMLYREDPERIIPFLRPYHGSVTSRNWHDDESIIDYFEKRLEMPIYQGLGEFHIHDLMDADSPVIRKTVQLAVERDLYIHVHSNHVAVETIFSYEPRVKVLWAHAGMSDPPEVVSDMFDRYENLWVDISIREYEIAPGGTLDPAWEKLFVDHPDRITIGSDTWVNAQWERYGDIIAFDRHWLGQLPPDIARKIAFENAQRLFN
jgi:hypothetical protein